MSQKLAEVGQFCVNQACESYDDIEKGQIIRFGQTAKGTQRYRCKLCGQTFVATSGTLFYRKQTARKEILETLALLAEGVRISSITRAKGHKEDTILAWLRQAAEHAEQMEALLMQDYQVSQAQIDALWTYVGHKGQKGGQQNRMRPVSSGVAH